VTEPGGAGEGGKKSERGGGGATFEGWGLSAGAKVLQRSRRGTLRKWGIVKKGGEGRGWPNSPAFGNASVKQVGVRHKAGWRKGEREGIAPRGGLSSPSERIG